MEDLLQVLVQPGGQYDDFILDPPVRPIVMRQGAEQPLGPAGRPAVRVIPAGLQPGVVRGPGGPPCRLCASS
ncbi:hypothetical protein XENTR_v10012998 [Xenopus tropicalis]|nr:hypothetical protein XENTR_v10012998 [Xenopus tropicalis]